MYSVRLIVIPGAAKFMQMGRNRLKNKPLVVIVGGGYAGCQVARKLDFHVNTLLIDPKNYRFHNVGALRV